MIPCRSRRFLFLRLLSVFLIFIGISSAFAAEQNTTKLNGPTYISGFNKADYRSVTTLNEFTLLVYRERWKNIDYDDVIAQLNQFSGAANSPALRETWRDILLGDFEGLKIRSGEQQNTLMAKRIELLNKLGFFHEAARLYNEASTFTPIPEIIAKQGVMALSLSGSSDGACLEIYMASNHLKSEEWKKDKALCAVYFGEKELAKTLYNEVKENAGSGFKAVYQMLNRKDNKAINVNIPPLWRTLLLSQGATVTSQVVNQADAMTLASLALHKKVPLPIRLTSANRAADLGALDSDRLRKLYEEKHPANSGLDRIITDAKAGKVLPQADYYAAARFTFSGQDRAIIVKNALNNIHPVTNIKSHIYSWIVDKLTLQVKTLGWFAPEGYAILASTNRLPSATLFFNQGELQKTRFAIINALLQGNPWPQAQQDMWKDAMRKFYKDKAEERLQEAMKLAAAYDVENKLILDVDSGTTKKTVKKTSVLRDSVRNGGRGLTLVSALNLVAKTPIIKNIPTEQFIDIIDVMAKQGLFRERKKLTLEFFVQSML